MRHCAQQRAPELFAIPRAYAGLEHQGVKRNCSGKMFRQRRFLRKPSN
jgi:hypothetical protein